MLPGNFVGYVKAYLMQTFGYWHIGTTSGIVCEINTDELGIQNTDLVEKITGADIQNSMDSVANRLPTIPLFGNIYNIAFMVWVSFFYCLVMIMRKRSRYILPVVPLLAIWATMMVAVPTFCDFRYMFSFHLAMPILLITMFIKREKSKDQ